MSSSPRALDPQWLVVSVQAPAPGEEILLVEALRRLGARAVEREGERFAAMLPHPPDVAALLGEAESVIRASTSIREPWIEVRPLGHTAWAEAWSRALPPRRVGERLVVAPRGAEVAAAPEDRVVRLVPGPGFGTAEHPTTRSCLRLLERYLSPGDRLVDVGSGSGILAIAAALLGAGAVLALELDPLACAAASANVSENAVSDRVELREVAVGPRTLDGEGRFDGVMANLQTEILIPLIPGLVRVLAAGGWVIVAGILTREREELLRTARASRLAPAEEEVEGGWWSAVLVSEPSAPGI